MHSSKIPSIGVDPTSRTEYSVQSTGREHLKFKFKIDIR